MTPTPMGLHKLNGDRVIVDASRIVYVLEVKGGPPDAREFFCSQVILQGCAAFEVRETTEAILAAWIGRIDDARTAEAPR